jgi:putative DNA primase/helicase
MSAQEAGSLMRTQAVGYARAGWRVIPCWTIRDGVCACGNPHCQAPGKHPLIKLGKGMAAASADVEVVEGWWGRWPDANIAVTLGVAGSGVIVVDLDIKQDEDGEFELEQWAASYGVDLPDTLEARTGSGGKHLFYALPSGSLPVHNVVGFLPAVDVRADGGYVMVPPSAHKSGAGYTWLTALAPAPVPAELLAAIRTARSKPGRSGAVSGEQPAYDYREACRTGPRLGWRDHFFNARAFELRKADWSKADASADLRRLWEAAEQRPGDEYPWEAVVSKLERVWLEVEPDEQPDWEPVTDAVSSDRTELDTDVGNAERFARLWSDQMRWTQEASWLAWDGVVWRSDAEARALQLGKQTVKQLFRDAALMSGDTRDRWLAWAKKSEGKARIESMVSLARVDERILEPLAAFDQQPDLLPLEGGCLDLVSGSLRELNREDKLTLRSYVRYDPDARSERLEAYLHAVTGGDLELLAYLQRAAGYTLTGWTTEEVLFLLYGPKGSGKSTFLDALQTAVGEYSMYTQPDTLMRQRGVSAAPRDELAAMRGKRLVVTTEPEEGARWAESLIKQLTGGDKVAARHLYRARFEYTPQFKLWVAANTAPRAHDDAIWRRMRRVPFPRTVPPEEQDHGLKLALKDAASEEARAFLAWAVAGALAWRRGGLGTSGIVELDTADYREEQDRFGRFMAETLEVLEVPPEIVGGSPDRWQVPDWQGFTPEWTCGSRELYATYVGWCAQEGEHPMTQTAFSQKLKERGLLKAPVRVRPISWYGVRVAREVVV